MARKTPYGYTGLLNLLFGREMTVKKLKTKDLKIGMYVEKAGDLSNDPPFESRNFFISSPNDIQKLIDNKIGEVFVDTSRKADVYAPSESEENVETFEVELGELAVGRDVPVDIFWMREQNDNRILLRQGHTFSEEVEEVCRGSGINIVNIRVSQRKLFDKYKHVIDSERSEQQEKGYSGKYLDNKKVEEYHAFKNNYLPINVYVIVSDTKPPFDIYAIEKEKPATVLEKDAFVGKDRFDELVERNIEFFIHKDHKEAFRGYLLEHTQKSRDTAARAAFVREGAKLLIEDLAENPRSEKLINDSKKTIADLTQVVLDDPNSFRGLMKINSYDYYTFTHSVNVATLSIALAISVGVTKDDGLHDLGLGALLHDLGKTKINDKLINKPGKLTDAEYKTVTHHVTLGYEMLKENKSIPERAFHPLLEHHEKLSGRGYPNKLVADDIHLLGRITAIIDIYDALTTQRSYKKAFTPFDALSLLSKNEEDYDRNIFTQFVQLIHKQET
ncbi:Response regulator [hydrothermal vent metagenome]|uniref:Response regulator n=1 Tax=hydrothermal vent metagenome TaxID=652676 RepID=A0A3B1CGA0_9ZZZZ